jgi:hypothetical protein
MKRILKEHNTLSQYQEDVADAVQSNDETANAEPLVSVYPVDEKQDDKRDDKNPER